MNQVQFQQCFMTGFINIYTKYCEPSVRDGLISRLLVSRGCEGVSTGDIIELEVVL